MTGTELDTKERILDAAERLFAERGVAATSLRAVTSGAGVNLAAVHYHFGSKSGLLSALFARRVAPINQERLKRLDQLEAATQAPDVESILEAFLAPVLAADRAGQSGNISALLFSEPVEAQAPLIVEIFGETSKRFVAALGRALPELSLAEVAERFRFVVGVMVHVISGHADIEIPPLAAAPTDERQRLRTMIVFLSAGLRSPGGSAS